MATAEEYLRRGAAAVEGWFDDPDDSGDDPAPEAVPVQYYGPEDVPTDTTDPRWTTQRTGGVPYWAILAAAALAAAGLVYVVAND